MRQPKNISRHKWQHWGIALLVALVAAFLTAAVTEPGSRMSLNNEPAANFSSDWELLDENFIPLPLPTLTLPLHLENVETVRIGKSIPEDVGNPVVLAFRSAHQRVRLYCDGELIYSFGYEQAPRFGKSPGAAWNLVRLPKDCAGKRLVLEQESPYASYQGKVEEMFVGSKAALLFMLIGNHGLSFVLTLSIFITGVVTLLIYLLVIRKDAAAGYETLHLGLFAVFVSLWLFGECRLTQFFGIPPAVNTCTTILAMLATPIPLANYIACSRRPTGRKLLNRTSYALAGMLVVCMGVQALGWMDFIQQMPYMHLGFAVAAGILLYTVIRETIYHPDARQYRLLLALGVLAVTFGLETAFLYLGSRSIGGTMRIGVLAFITMQAQEAFRNAAQMMRLSRLASVDVLTGCLNRTAYSQSLLDLDGKQRIGVVIADVNDLKYINDTFGHAAGDDAIVRCSQNFSEIFSPYGRCFRIGGDEFAMLGKNLTPERLESLTAAFLSRNEAGSGETAYPFSVSCGYTVYDDNNDQALTDTVRRADKAMYEQKRRSKEQSAKSAAGAVPG